MKNSSTALNVCVGNYGRYAEGVLVDKWVGLPMEPDELEAWKTSSGVADAAHEETYISDTEGWLFGSRSLEYMSLEDANRVAIAMSQAA